MGYYLSRQFRNALQAKQTHAPPAPSELDLARAEAATQRARVAELEALLAVATIPQAAAEKDSAGRRPRG